MLILYEQPLSALIRPSRQPVQSPLDLSPAAQYAVPRLVDRSVVATNGDSLQVFVHIIVLTKWRIMEY